MNKEGYMLHYILEKTKIKDEQIFNHNIIANQKKFVRSDIL